MCWILLPQPAEASGRSLPDFLDRNLPAVPTGSATYAVVGSKFNGQKFSVPFYTGARPNAAFGRITEVSSFVQTRYDALVIQANRRMASGLQFQSNYTLARNTDNGQSSQTFTTGNGALDPNNRKLEEGRSGFETRHRFVTSLVWQPDYFKDSNRVVRSLLSNFSIAPVVSLASGRPYTASVSGNAPGVKPSTGILGAGGDNRAPFIPRNAFSFPSTKNVDLRISRRFNIGEVGKLEVLSEAFNLFNHVNVTNVNSRLYTISTATAASFAGTGTPAGCSANYSYTGIAAGTSLLCTDPIFGIPSAAGNTVFRERQIQFALRFEF